MAGPPYGNEGGYVAVRAKADTYQTTKSGKRYAVGYVTNAIEGDTATEAHEGERDTAPDIARRPSPENGFTRRCARMWMKWGRRKWMP